ncbi:putative surface protein with fasciclin (FAS1) repeats [Branchiibius hedensis]|uniref:Uncaracterized surface protein containing fasciclin (FAS1) repeats n=2 Tax=Branchiibius hedensis TaxID=672460 RepID=A0A2Y8ZRI9_9MICO|nr:fasciclin domain-containing protein [Branchiibius hedensis]PWJ26169.1 putative surface protein with fasciclin (FAS1) repeats [Branchiibius hedensis]SSA34981.1 Uncaracterized surface protein containing fasciclin (FAS1) repeats [Branchiibius hedensis]
MKTRSTFTLAAAALVMPMALAACGSSSSDSGSSAASPMATTSSSAPMTSESSSPMTSMESSSSSAANAMAPFGAGCAKVPASGKGSFSGMTSDPVATAASNNPLLSTLVTAVKKAGLVDTLNNAKALTVFAPTNDAFAKIPAADLNKLLADKAALTKVLTGHVVAGKLDPMAVVGDHKSLAGSMVKVTGAAPDLKVDGTASVVCGNVQTANATVYIVDTVLPGSMG